MEVANKTFGFVCFFAVVMGAFYSFISKGRVLSLGTWANLEKQFGTPTMPDRYIITSAKIGLGEYRDTFKVALADEGAYLDTPWLFKFDSKPLLIPYKEFTVLESKQTIGVFNKYTQFMVRGQRVCLAPDIAQKIISRKD